MRSLLVVLCVLGPLGALPARGELPKDEQKCIVEINKNVAKVAKAQGKDICRCIKDGAKGKLVEATIEDCLTADGRGKVDKARSKLSAKLADKCPADPNAAPGFGVPTEGIDPNSLSATAIASEISLIHRIFGSDLDIVILPAKDPNDPAVKPSSKCQLNVAKAAKKCFDTKWKVFNKCKKNGLKGKLPPGAIEGAEDLERLCLRSDPNDPNLPGQVDLKGKISKACGTKLQAKIDKKCGPDADRSRAFPRFDPNGPLTLRAFVDQRVECEFCKLVNATDGLGRNCDRFDDGALNGSCDEDLTVANLNILHGAFCPDPPDACRQPDRIDLLFQWVAASGCPDIVTLQEVIQFEALNLDMVPLIEAQLESVCPFAYEAVFEPTLGIDEEMILTRYPLVAVEQRVLFQGFRKVLHARIDHPIGPVDVFTTHLASGADLGNNPCGPSCPAECVSAAATTIRDCQAVQMAEFIDSRHDVDAPAVATGDFNAPPGSFVYQQFVGRGWIDVHLAAGNPECNPGSGVGCTSGRESEDLSEIESPLPNVGSRIDYIFLIPPGPGSTCAAGIDGPTDADGDGTATRIFADDPNPFAPSCGPTPDPVCWPSDHEGVELDLNCR